MNTSLLLVTRRFAVLKVIDIMQLYIPWISQIKLLEFE